MISSASQPRTVTAAEPARIQVFDALTGLRGLASIWVALGHLYGAKGFLIASSGLGVDIFFVLSGFIISHAHAQDFDGRYSARKFLRFIGLRLSRVYPLHIVTTLALLPMVVLPGFLERFHPNAFSGLNFVANIFLVQSWTFFLIPAEYRGPGWSWNVPSWSLSVEWLVYLLFPLTFIVVSKFRSPRILIALAIAAIATLLITLSIYFGELSGGGLGKPGMLKGLAEFTCGIILFRLRQLSPDFKSFAERYCSLTALIFVAVASLETYNPISIFALILIVPGLAESNGLFSKLCSHPAVRYFGDISFSIYLCHIPLILLSNYVAFKSGYTEEWSTTIVPRLFLLALIWAVSHFTYHWIERPSRSIGRSIVNRHL